MGRCDLISVMSGLTGSIVCPVPVPVGPCSVSGEFQYTLSASLHGRMVAGPRFCGLGRPRGAVYE